MESFQDFDPGEMGVSVKLGSNAQDPEKTWLRGSFLKTWNRWKDKIPLGERYDIDGALRFLQAHYETEKLSLEQWQAKLPPKNSMADIVLRDMRQNRSYDYWLEGPFSEDRIEVYSLLAAKESAPSLDGTEYPAIWLERPSAWLTYQSGLNLWLLWAMRLRCGLMRRDIDHGNLMMLWYIQALQELEEMGAGIQAILDF